MTSALVRHAGDDAPSKAEYERMLAAAEERDKRQRKLEDRFITLGAGRMGLRSGELLHLHEGWIDYDAKLIQIPMHDDCQCRYCQERAAEIADRHDTDIGNVLDIFWMPKYRASARTIPYDTCPGSVEIIETFLKEIGHLDMCQSTLCRRVNRLEEDAKVSNVYPHALRAAAALYWARQGLEAVDLMALMGWKSLDVAECYLRKTGQRLPDRMRQLGSAATAKEELDAEALPNPAEAVYDALEETNPRTSQTKYHHETGASADDGPPISLKASDQASFADFAEG